MAKEKFDYEIVKKDLDKLQGYFDKYRTSMNLMDIEVNGILNIGANSALYGKKAQEVLKMWNDNCAIFKNFYGIFHFKFILSLTLFYVINQILLCLFLNYN